MKIVIKHFWTNRVAYKTFLFTAMMTVFMCGMSVLFVAAAATNHLADNMPALLVYVVVVPIPIYMIRSSIQEYRKASCEVGSLSEMRLYCSLTPEQLAKEEAELMEYKLSYQQQLRGYEEQLKALEMEVQKLRNEQSALDAKVKALNDKFSIVQSAYATHAFDKKIYLCQSARKIMG